MVQSVIYGTISKCHFRYQDNLVFVRIKLSYQVYNGKLPSVAFGDCSTCICQYHKSEEQKAGDQSCHTFTGHDGGLGMHDGCSM